MEGSQGPQEPSLADIARMQQKLLEAVEASKTPEEARERVAEQVQEESERSGEPMSDEDARKVADMTISQLEARGAFGPPAQEPAEPAGSEPAESGEPAEGGAPVGGDGGGGAPEGEPASESGPTDEPPVKKSIAERFQGR